MSTAPRPTSRAAAVGAAGVVAAALLAGCGGEATPGEVVVTVTASTKDATGGSESPSRSATTKPAPAETVKSEDVGRKFDFGVVKSVTTEDGTLVFAFDRWTVPTLDDTELADNGIEVKPYDRSRNPYDNVNTTNTFRVPVRDGASFLLHHCVSKDEPVTSKSVDAKELAAADAADALILLEIDPKTGYATGGETLAGC